MIYQKGSNLFNVAIYIRLSREDGDKEESDSVGNQRKLLTEYVNKHDDFILYDVYIDDGFTGTNFNRPDFHRMIADIEDNKVNCVVVKDLSRFGRDYIDTGRYLERIFPELNVRFISVTDNIDSMKQAYDMLLPIKNIFNEQYARDISNKIQATVKSKQKAGEFIGAFTSYGYKKSPANKNKLVIDEYASEVVKRVFTMYAQGIGKQSIAKILNAEGILCPSEYKKLNGENYKNCNRLEKTSYWTYSTIKVMLQNELYIGNMVQGKKHQRMRSKQRPVEKENWIRVENTHEPIIDRQLWDKVQKLLTKKHRDIDLETNKNIFAGFIKCGDCGRAMMKNFWRRADGSKTANLKSHTTSEMNWNIYFQAFTVRTWRKRLSNLNTFLTPHIYWGIHITICVNYNQHMGDGIRAPYTTEGRKKTIISVLRLRWVKSCRKMEYRWNIPERRMYMRRLTRKRWRQMKREWTCLSLFTEILSLQIM